jgi:hypothetical protein
MSGKGAAAVKKGESSGFFHTPERMMLGYAVKDR